MTDISEYFYFVKMHMHLSDAAKISAVSALHAF